MKCSQCNHENKAGAQFCVKCGAPIAAKNICNACSTENKPGAKFCKKCGQPLVTLPDPDPVIEKATQASKTMAEHPIKSDRKKVQEKPKHDIGKPALKEPKQYVSKFSVKPLWLITAAAVIALAVAAYFLIIDRPVIPEEIAIANPTTTAIKIELTVNADGNDANLEALIGNWEGTVENDGASFEYEMRFKQGCEINNVCGSFNIPSISCAGEFTIIEIKGDKYYFEVSNVSDGCGGTATEEFVEILSPIALRFHSVGDFGLTSGTLSKK